MSQAGPFSVHHPTQVFTGRGWDAQTASLLFLPKAPSSILLLGLGGATAARQCRHLFPAARITAVESDSEIISTARQLFGLDNLRLNVVCDRAESYLARSQSRFDAIIDDAWPTTLLASRSAVDDINWVSRLIHMLKPQGAAAVNILSHGQDDGVYRRVLERMRRMGLCVREVGLPGRLTTVLVAGSNLLDGHHARGRIAFLPSGSYKALSVLSYRSHQPLRPAKG